MAKSREFSSIWQEFPILDWKSVKWLSSYLKHTHIWFCNENIFDWSFFFFFNSSLCRFLVCLFPVQCMQKRKILFTIGKTVKCKNFSRDLSTRRWIVHLFYSNLIRKSLFGMFRWYSCWSIENFVQFLSSPMMSSLFFLLFLK